MLRPFFPELVMSTDLLSFEHPSVLLFCFEYVEQFMNGKMLDYIKKKKKNVCRVHRRIFGNWSHNHVISPTKRTLMESTKQL